MPLTLSSEVFQKFTLKMQWNPFKALQMCFCVFFFISIITPVCIRCTNLYSSLLTSISPMCSHCLGLSSAAKKAIKSRAVSRVCRRDDTKTSTGLSGEWVLMAVGRKKLGLQCKASIIQDSITGKEFKKKVIFCMLLE